MAEEKAGCLTWVLVAVGFIPGAIMGAFIPEWLHIVALVVSVIVVLICSVMVAVNKKPEFEDETFGHACKRFMWKSLGAIAIGAAVVSGFFVFGDKDKSSDAGAKQPAVEQSVIED